MLRPHETVQKLLLSSPSRFMAEYEASDFVLTHAWKTNRFTHDDQSSLARHFFILSFTTQETEKAPGVMVPDYAPTGELMCTIMVVLFGKRFDHHDPVEMTGMFHVPDLSLTGELCEQSQLYHGGRPRADYPAALDLRELARFHAIIEQVSTNQSLREAFQTAALFYARALRAVARDPEVAYPHLITAFERLAEAAPLTEIELEALIATALSRIEQKMADGDRIARMFRNRMRHLKRRFAGPLTSHLDNGFFSRTEAQNGWGALKAAAFPRATAAACDLRSRYLHTGSAFGNWVTPGPQNAECQPGNPIVADREMAKILTRAPTFIGLERITRIVLLKCAENLGAKLPPSGRGDSAATRSPHIDSRPKGDRAGNEDREGQT